MSQVKSLAADVSAMTIAGKELQAVCHGRAVEAGWWENLQQRHPLTHDERMALVPTKLMLVVSELAEAMEAHRKGLKDDKLPHRDGLEVELADAIIRIFDLGGALGMDLGGALAEKMVYNARRPDHQRAARMAPGGKSY